MQKPPNNERKEREGVFFGFFCGFFLWQETMEDLQYEFPNRASGWASKRIDEVPKTRVRAVNEPEDEDGSRLGGERVS